MLGNWLLAGTASRGLDLTNAAAPHAGRRPEVHVAGLVETADHGVAQEAGMPGVHLDGRRADRSPEVLDLREGEIDAVHGERVDPAANRGVEVGVNPLAARRDPELLRHAHDDVRQPGGVRGRGSYGRTPDRKTLMKDERGT